jgi:pseudouridine-5'-phosphate glycosidase
VTQRKRRKRKKKPLKINYSPSVQQALDQREPLLALESTVITHGLPRPQNLELARAMERTAAENGAVPATIAVLDGAIHIGLTEA